jgi:hypothetical protein
MKQRQLFWKIIFLCLIISQKNYSATLSFDTLFPMTWYEKGLNATVFVLNKIRLFCEQEQCAEELFFDVILGKCLFAYFCFEKMSHSKKPLIEEDITYVTFLVNTLENYVTHIEYNHEYEGHKQCLENIIIQMKDHLHIPSNVNAK